MPASLKRLRDSDTSVYLHVCEVCGANAPFGVGVNLRLAMERLAAGDLAGAKRHLGKWFCREHRPKAGDGPA